MKIRYVFFTIVVFIFNIPSNGLCNENEFTLLVISSPHIMWKYKIDAPENKVILISSESISEKPGLYVDLESERVLSLREKRDAARRAKDLPVGVTSIVDSPDGSMIAYMYEDTLGNTIKTAYARTNQRKKIITIKSDNTMKAFDFTWSQNSRYLIILDRSERYSKKIFSMIRTIFGHGDVLSSYSVLIVDTMSGKTSRYDVLSDIPDGLAVLK